MTKIIAIMTGGALGALMRYLIGTLVISSNFPLSTLIVNMVGCLIIGILFPITSKFAISPEWHALMFIGFLGAFTTFSTFALETSKLLNNQQWLCAITNILVSNFAGITMVIIGFAISKLALLVIK